MPKMTPPNLPADLTQVDAAMALGITVEELVERFGSKRRYPLSIIRDYAAALRDFAGGRNIKTQVETPGAVGEQGEDSMADKLARELAEEQRLRRYKITGEFVETAVVQRELASWLVKSKSRLEHLPRRVGQFVHGWTRAQRETLQGEINNMLAVLSRTTNSTKPTDKVG